METTTEAKRQLAINLYLAGLTSDPRPLEPALRPMRAITAGKRNPDASYTEDEKRTLQRVGEQLENYLITKEPLRSFSHESIQQKLYEHFEGDGRIRRIRYGVAGTTAAMAVAAGVAIMKLPIGGLTERLSLAATLGMLVGFWGLMYSFLSALKTFSAATRQSLVLICTGAGVIGLNLLLRPYLTAVHHDQISLVWIWLAATPWPVGFIIIYLGFARLARLVGVKNWLTNVWLVLGLAAVSSCTIWLTLGLGVRDGSVWYGLVVADRWAHAFLRLGTVAISVLLLRRLQGAYREPFVWLAWALGVMTAGTTIEIVSAYLAYGDWQRGGALNIETPLPANLLFVASVLLYIRAGYGFNKLKQF